MIVHTQLDAPRSSAYADHGSTRMSLVVLLGTLTRLLPDFAHVSITVPNGTGAPSTLAHVGDLARDLGDMQQSSREGPSVDALRTCTLVAAPDIGHDDRWATYLPLAAARGLRSQIAVPLVSHTHPLGTLDLYSTTQGPISQAAPAVAEAVATQLVEVLMGLQEIEHLRRALDNRACIGQATGMVMGQLHVDADQAFSYLRRISMDQNRKLSLVAQEMVRTRRLPSTRPD